MKSDNKILQDHLRKGKYFYPKFIYNEDGSQRMNLVNWRADLVPELFWIGLFIEKEGFHEAKRTLCTFVGFVDRCLIGRERRNLGIISGYRNISSEQAEPLLDQLEHCGLLALLQETLAPLIFLFPECPLKFLFSTKPELDEIEAGRIVGKVLDACLYRVEKLSTLVQGIYHDMLVSSGMLHIPSHFENKNSDNLEKYPDSEESRNLAAYYRCTATGIPMEMQQIFKDEEWKWPKHFWEAGLEIGNCHPGEPEGLSLADIPLELNLFNTQCFGEYNLACGDILDSLMAEYPFNLHEPTRDHILLGLASRIYRLCVQIVSFSTNWVGDTDSIFVRLAAESYIYFKWFLKFGTPESFKEFYDHGSGKQKLRKEHLDKYFDSLGMDPKDSEVLNAGLNFLKKHKIPDFVAVNLGSPLKNKNIHKLAIEAGLDELYHLIVDPASSFIHGTFDCIDNHYLVECKNPFHGGHKIPYFWSKSPVSTFGLSQLLYLVDWVIEDLCELLGKDIPETLPGEQYLEKVFSKEKLEEFSSQEHIKNFVQQQEAQYKKARNKPKPKE